MILVWGHYALVIFFGEQTRQTALYSTFHTPSVGKDPAASCQSLMVSELQLPFLPTSGAILSGLSVLYIPQSVPFLNLRSAT